MAFQRMLQVLSIGIMLAAVAAFMLARPFLALAFAIGSILLRARFRAIGFKSPPEFQPRTDEERALVATATAAGYHPVTACTVHFRQASTGAAGESSRQPASDASVAFARIFGPLAGHGGTIELNRLSDGQWVIVDKATWIA